jgi:hypothetical protein
MPNLAGAARDNTARTEAGDAQAAADAAQAAADTAQAAAASAQTAAGSAQDAADAAQVDADAAAAAAAAAQSTADASVPKSLYDAQSILGAITDNNPVAIPVGASSLFGRAASGDIGALTPAQAKAILDLVGNPYLAKPLSPNAFDDEFGDGGSPDLAVRGWTVTNSAGTTLTRPSGSSGDIRPRDTTGPVGNTYWSTICGGWIFLQAAPGVQIDIRKAITLAAGDTVAVRMGGSYNVSPAAGGRYNEAGFYAIAGGALDGNNRVYATLRDDNTASQWTLWDFARFTGGGIGSNVSRLPFGVADIRAFYFDSGTTHQIQIINTAANQVATANITGAPAAGTLTHFGMRNLFSTSGGNVAQLWAIGFVRRKTGGAWLIP